MFLWMSCYCIGFNVKHTKVRNLRYTRKSEVKQESYITAVTQHPINCRLITVCMWQSRSSSFIKQTRLKNDTLEVKLLISFKYDSNRCFPLSFSAVAVLHASLCPRCEFYVLIYKRLGWLTAVCLCLGKLFKLIK